MKTFCAALCVCVFFLLLFLTRIYFSRNQPKDLNAKEFQHRSENTFDHLTFSVQDGEVGVGGTYSEDELVSDEGLVRVDGAYRLNQLRRREQKYGGGGGERKR